MNTLPKKAFLTLLAATLIFVSGLSLRAQEAGNRNYGRDRAERTPPNNEPLDRSAFDAVLNAGGIEPRVQCTLFMKVMYSIAQ